MTARIVLATLVRSARAPDVVRDTAGLGGAVLVSIGVGQIYQPAGLIVAGVFLLAGTLLSSRVRG